MGKASTDSQENIRNEKIYFRKSAGDETVWFQPKAMAFRFTIHSAPLRTSFLFTIDYFYGIFQPNAQVAQNKNEKILKTFYSFRNKHLEQKGCLQFCRFSHQTCRYVQL
jgi:hypothetical protein